ncbi:TPA: hypothetical protein DDX46_04260 [Candidatus Saccharibacteria bacterium]|nr:MAG: hypothetical protein UW38_C0001G0675 [Candidatus Saccharibacteria bacterium GW2011_GWC2_44_17]OGL33706.1 MAG: hypothetical protein A3E20_03055 [Candidatus Saccharibacteria bacterium RIFCSPHIGHO2_12_FULL_47_16]HBH77928.1 hypothetical protein [Candidatus Saccharibacteria bacterium]
MIKNSMSTTESLRLDAQELLAVPTVADRLGDYAVHLSGVTDRLVHTELDSMGFLELEDEHTNQVPLVLRHLGRRAAIHANNSGMNSEQVNSLSLKLGPGKTSTAKKKTRQYFSDSQSHRELPVFEDEDSLAVTGANFWLPEPNTIVYGRPYISMNVDAAMSGRLSPIVALHELTHVVQKEGGPIGRVETLTRDKIRHELEAYYVAAQIILGMKDAGRQRELLEHTPRYELEKALKIENLRLESQSNSDPFDPNNQVVKSMVDNELGVTAEVGKIIRNKNAKQ